jgi:hypothetical protein
MEPMDERNRYAGSDRRKVRQARNSEGKRNKIDRDTVRRNKDQSRSVSSLDLASEPGSDPRLLINIFRGLAVANNPIVAKAVEIYL